MKRFYALIVAASLCLPSISAVAWWQSIQQVAVSSATFTGPGDIISFTYWGGARAYSAATRGTKALNVCNVADAFCGDLSTDPTTGLLVVGTVGGSNCAVVTCTVKIIYDKVGTNDVTQATISQRPVLTQNALNTAWGMTSTTATINATGTGYTASQPYSFVSIQNVTNATGAQVVMAVDNSFAGAVLFANSTLLQVYSGGSAFNVAATAAFHATQTIFNGASTILTIDGVDNTGTAGTQSLTAYPLGLPGEAGGNQSIAGVIMEGGYIPGTISPANRIALNSNLHAAYGGW